MPIRSPPPIPGILGDLTLDGGTLTAGTSGALGIGTLNLVSGTLSASAALTLPNAFTLANSLAHARRPGDPAAALRSPSLATARSRGRIR